MGIRDLLRVPDWIEEAACKTYPTDGYFFVPDRSRKKESELPGLAICQTCQVKDECLDFALANRLREGIFGGRTAQQRKRMRRKHLVSL